MGMAYDDNDDVILTGATDSTQIGNIGDRLKVDSVNTSTAVGVPSFIGTSLRYNDFNIGNGGVARGTPVGNIVPVTVYSVTGSGMFIGFLVNLESIFDAWEVKLIIDGTTIFTLSTQDLENDSLYDYGKNSNGASNHLGIDLSDKAFRFRGPMQYPLRYSTSIAVTVRYLKTGTKQFRAGLATRTV